MLNSILSFFSNFFLVLECFITPCVITPKVSHIYLGNHWIVKFVNGDVNHYTFMSGYPHLEHYANVNILNVTNNFWSILNINELFIYLFILILVLPLIYCVLTLFFFLKNQIKVLQRGKINSFEDKTPNFTNLTKNYWRILWSHAYDIIPRYTRMVPYKQFPLGYF